MNMTQEQIETEFRRQVRLCSGIGLRKQLEIVCAFHDVKPIVFDSDGKREPREVMKPPEQDGDWG